MKPMKALEHEDVQVNEQTLAVALANGVSRRACTLQAATVQFLVDFQALMIGFSDRTAVLLPVAHYPELAELSTTELNQLELGFAGSALCLESRDMHLSIAAMVSASEPLMAMAASLIATRNGKRSSKAKASASRVNGMKGGRPRKLIVES
jgi:hypothetical protein